RRSSRMTESCSWCSLHVYFHSDQDSLLVGCVDPLSRELKSRGLISLLFYLRYWRGGPHVRLRFLANGDCCRETALKIACDRISESLRLHPSSATIDRHTYRDIERQSARFENGTTDEGDLHANNSWTIEKYEPELTKYGGSRGIAIAEQAFD